MTSAVVVGSGPNGLAAAVRLAQEGLDVTVLERADRVGGGTRTSELTVPGLLHDECSAFHPMGVASPFLSSLDLASHGLRWLWPEIDLAHPLDDGRAGVVSRDMARTVASLGVDGRAWEKLFEPISDGFDDLLADVLRPVVHVPSHPVRLARFGLNAALPANLLVRRFDDEPAKALFMGVAAHVFGRLDTPLSASVGLMLSAAGHRYGWPVAEGGSQAIADALVSLLESLGGSVRTGVDVTSLRQLADVVGGRPDVVVLDTSPRGALDIVGDALPSLVARQLRAYRYGPAAFKIDLAVEGGIPWTNDDVGRAGTVHVAGSAAEIVEAEGRTAKGVMPERPFVLLGQQHVADPSRSQGDVHPIWAYAHVPHAWPGDATEQIIGQVERFAPGFRERIVQVVSKGTAALEAYNPNYVGGDIGTGANTWRQIPLRPRPTLSPYELGVDGVYLCSAATPPGGGVHGMGGFNAAEAALRHL
jgi:phytoene dehydrogenase-like protein